MRPIIRLALVTGATLLGCGGAGIGGSSGAASTSPLEICGWFAHQPNKQGDCPPLATALPVYDTVKCESAITSACDEADRQQLDEFIACYTALAPCIYPKELTFSSEVALCSAQHPVKNTCATALRSIEPK